MIDRGNLEVTWLQIPQVNFANNDATANDGSDNTLDPGETYVITDVKEGEEIRILGEVEGTDSKVVVRTWIVGEN